MADMVIMEKETVVDKDNKVITSTSKEKTLHKVTEPEYIKIYTKMWCEFNSIPSKYRELFFQLAIRMSYCCADDLDGSQLVNVSGPYKKAIMNACGWKTETPIVRGLKVLCECGAIKRMTRGFYQINPSYAGKGPWRYNQNLKQGGIENLVASFNFKEKTVTSSFVYVDEDDDSINSYIEAVDNDDIEPVDDYPVDDEE